MSCWAFEVRLSFFCVLDFGVMGWLHLPLGPLLGSWVILIIVQVLGKYNPFLLLINPPLIINNKSGNPKMPHEHFKRGCPNFKRSKTIMN